MNSSILLLASLSIFGWGIGNIFAKLSTKRIGSHAVFWDILAYAAAIIIFCLINYKLPVLLKDNKTGILFGLIAGLIGSAGLVSVYMLLAKSEASKIIPLTSLYPAVTVILAFIFLRESVTPAKIAGILFALLAVYLLSK